MRLTPVEIEAEKFTRRLRGYDVAEVDAFRRLVAAAVGELIEENEGLKDEIARLKAELESLKARERDIQQTLDTARQLAEQVKEQARREADVLRVEAELEGEKIKQAAQKELGDIRNEIVSLRAQKTRLISELRGILDGHGRILEIYEEELQPSSVRVGSGEDRGGAGGSRLLGLHRLGLKARMESDDDHHGGAPSSRGEDFMAAVARFRGEGAAAVAVEPEQEQRPMLELVSMEPEPEEDEAGDSDSAEDKDE